MTEVDRLIVSCIIQCWCSGIGGRSGTNPQRYRWITKKGCLLFQIFTLNFRWAAATGARNYRPCFRENQPKRSFSIKWKRAFWACFRENWVYKFGHGLKCFIEIYSCTNLTVIWKHLISLRIYIEPLLRKASPDIQIYVAERCTCTRNIPVGYRTRLVWIRINKINISQFLFQLD